MVGILFDSEGPRHASRVMPASKPRAMILYRTAMVAYYAPAQLAKIAQMQFNAAVMATMAMRLRVRQPVGTLFVRSSATPYPGRERMYLRS